VLPANSSLACTQQVGARRIELFVHCSDPGWNWEVRFADGETLSAGEAATRIAGQVEAQRAFELRLKRAGLDLNKFSGYRWNPVYE
jgi:hypothetical protein